MANNITFSYSHGSSTPSVPYRLNDGLANVLSGLGTGSDGHSAASRWFTRPIDQTEIEASWRTSWLSRKVHSVPVNDIIRPWRRWIATPEQIKLIEKEERRLGLRQRVRKALLFSRLYGGAAIVMGVLGDSPSEPLDVAKVKAGGLSYLHVLTRYELMVQGVNMDPGSPQYGEPLSYIVNGGTSTIPLHPSRVVRFVNGELPDKLAFAEQTWGDPLLMSLRDVLINADAAQGNFAALTGKARTSTLKIPGLVNMIATSAGEQALIKKTQLAKQFEGMFHVNLISAPAKSGEAGEEWQHDQINFANLSEIGTWFIQNVAGASDIPLTRLFGMSAAGLNSTGDGDLSNYHASLDTGRELDLRPRLEMIDEVLIRSALGSRDENIWFTYEPFEVDSDEIKVKNAQGRATALKTLSESNTVPSEVLAKIAKASIIDSGDYPGAEDAYKEFDAAGGDLAEINPPAADNDNGAIGAATEAGVAAGKSASVAAADARAMLTDAQPMTLYVSRPVENASDIREHFEAQGVAVTVLDDKMHVTIAYSRTPVDWFAVSPDDWREPVLKLPEGDARMMEVFGTTLVQLFASSQLSWRHEEILRAGATWDHPSYQPHYSLDYSYDGVSVEGIKPWLGPIVLGAERFEEIDTTEV